MKRIELPVVSRYQQMQIKCELPIGEDAKHLKLIVTG
jgi:hypothetical protein